LYIRMPKRAHSIRLEERQWRILEALGREIGKRTNYPESSVTQLIETAIDKYILLLGRERAAYRKVINTIGSAFESCSKSDLRSAARVVPTVVRMRKPRAEEQAI
jgi:hypothetical protein